MIKRYIGLTLIVLGIVFFVSELMTLYTSNSWIINIGKSGFFEEVLRILIGLILLVGGVMFSPAFFIITPMIILGLILRRIPSSVQLPSSSLSVVSKKPIKPFLIRDGLYIFFSLGTLAVIGFIYYLCWLAPLLYLAREGNCRGSGGLEGIFLIPFVIPLIPLVLFFLPFRIKDLYGLGGKTVFLFWYHISSLTLIILSIFPPLLS